MRCSCTACSPCRARGERTRTVDWCQSAALLVRREAAAQVGYLDPDFFVYSDEVDFARRLRDAGWQSIYVPGAVAVHHEQLSTDVVPERRIVELARNRDLYMRKHHSAAAAAVVRLLTAWTYAVRALAALVLPGHSARRYWRHVTRDARARPWRGRARGGRARTTRCQQTPTSGPGPSGSATPLGERVARSAMNRRSAIRSRRSLRYAAPEELPTRCEVSSSIP